MPGTRHFDFLRYLPEEEIGAKGKSRRTRTRRSAQEWSKILTRFERGGQNHREFCQREGLALSTFQWWWRELGRVQRGREDHDEAWFVDLIDESAGREKVESSTPGRDVAEYRPYLVKLEP